MLKSPFDLLDELRTQGYSVIRRALSSEEVQGYRRAILEGEQSEIRQPPYLGHAGNGKDISVLNALSAFGEFVELVDHPCVFDLVLAAMGPYIQVVGAEVMVRFPSPQGLLPLHTDGGPSLREILPSEQSNYLALKCQYFLSPCSLPNHGNFSVVPGSHLRRFPQSVDEILSTTPEQLIVEAGDAVVFPWSLWHGVSAHHGREPRESVIVKYGQRWAQPDDQAPIKSAVAESLSSRQRLLMPHLLEGDGNRSVPSGYRWVGSEYLDVMFGEGSQLIELKERYERVVRVGKALYA